MPQRLTRTGIRTAFIIFPALMLLSHASADQPDANTIIRNAINHWRGTSSYSVVTMTIHRPDWERNMTLRSWTLGEKNSLVRVTEPAKDAGNATLLMDKKMWTFSPKINRVIKIPSSMMNQSWMGSDFSNKDIARSDDIIDEYRHTVIGTETQQEHTVYVIESIPKEHAAVVWGKERIKIRDDHIIVEHAFFDQAMVLTKQLQTLAIGPMGGRTVATQQRMVNVENPQEWTQIAIESAEYNLDIPEHMFTLSNLRNPRL
jgi:outer membrane lipoprotein-sorting protein